MTAFPAIWLTLRADIVQHIYLCLSSGEHTIWHGSPQNCIGWRNITWQVALPEIFKLGISWILADY
jgi:hypothetical protein